MSKKQIFLWTLYDFANSITIGVWALYFSQWLVIDNKVSDVWFNAIFAGASLLLIFAGPVYGAIADKCNNQMRYIRIATVGQYIFGFVTAGITLFGVPGNTTSTLAAIGFLGIAFFYQFSLGFYNALLPKLGPPERHGLVSGIGQFGNWMGQVVGLLATLPFALGAVHWFGASGRAQPLLPAVILFMIFSLPMLFWFKEGGERQPMPANVKHELRHYWHGLKMLWVLPGVGMFLLAFFFFNDALLTTANNFPIYIDQVFGVSDHVKVFMMLGILVTSAIGGLIGGWLADRAGLRRMLLIILASWILFFPILGLTIDFRMFVVEVVTMGFLYGATWSVTRAVMASLLPADELNHGFSYYTLFERFSTFVGPFAWGAITTGLVSWGPGRYQIAALAMAAFVVVGFLLARKIKFAR